MQKMQGMGVRLQQPKTALKVLQPRHQLHQQAQTLMQRMKPGAGQRLPRQALYLESLVRMPPLSAPAMRPALAATQQQALG